jgi:hypothetical protein
MRFLERVATKWGWQELDFASFMERGGRTRIRALGDWYSLYIAPNNKACEEIAGDPHPEVALAATVRGLKTAGGKIYRARELVSQVATFYNSFANMPGIGTNGVISAILNEWDTPPKPPQKYSDVMPIENVLAWLQNLGDNAILDRFSLYRKFLVTLQICCIARTADIFRLRFDTLERDRPPGSLTFVTSTKTSRGKGFLYYLFEIPNSPRVCPVQTTLAFKNKFEEQARRDHWSFPPHFIHVNERGIPFKSATQLAALLKKVYQEAGIDTGKWNVNNARHAVITFYKGRGISEEQIKLITGHSVRSRVTHDFYTHPVKEWADSSVLSVLSSEQPKGLPPASSFAPLIPRPAWVSPSPKHYSPSDPDFLSESDLNSDDVEVIIAPRSQGPTTIPCATPQSVDTTVAEPSPAPTHITDHSPHGLRRDE